MLSNDINLNQLRVFESVYRNRSMTKSARELHLTQSGVSQHIGSLEDVMGIKLFDRIKQSLVPTDSGKRLADQCKSSFDSLATVIDDIKGGKNVLAGTVAIGMPTEFGLNVLMPLLSEFGKKHSKVKIVNRLGLASELNKLMLEGEIDFAFVDAFGGDKRITTKKVFDEVLELCMERNVLADLNAGPIKHTRGFYESLQYVSYEDGEPVLRLWFGHHLKSRNLNLHTKTSVMDVLGVARFVSNGLGAGVLPRHMRERIAAEGVDLHVFKGCGKPLTNTISVAYLKEKTQSLAVTACLDFLNKKI